MVTDLGFSEFIQFEEDKGGTWVRRRLEFDFAELCHEEGTCIGVASATPSWHQALLKAAPAAGIVVIVRGRDEER
jgi:hypothetical protein